MRTNVGAGSSQASAKGAKAARWARNEGTVFVTNTGDGACVVDNGMVEEHGADKLSKRPDERDRMEAQMELP